MAEERTKPGATAMLRIRFDGITADGNGSIGSRFSHFHHWHAGVTIVRDANNDWSRTTGDAMESAENRVGLGHQALRLP
jgi:hypothetical protein